MCFREQTQISWLCFYRQNLKLFPGEKLQTQALYIIHGGILKAFFFFAVAVFRSGVSGWISEWDRCCQRWNSFQGEVMRRQMSMPPHDVACLFAFSSCRRGYLHSTTCSTKKDTKLKKNDHEKVVSYREFRRKFRFGWQFTRYRPISPSLTTIVKDELRGQVCRLHCLSVYWVSNFYVCLGFF